jgi:hypothetical protein
MKAVLLFNLPLTGGLIEWTFVILLNIALILFCALYGLYDSIERFYGTDSMFAIVFGPVFACIIYTATYLSLICDDNCCEQPTFRFKIPLWLIRVTSLLYQVLHAGLFILFLASDRDSLIITAFWLYAIIPFGLLMCYWSFLLYTEVRAIASREYKEALEAEQRQVLTAIQSEAVVKV